MFHLVFFLTEIISSGFTLDPCTSYRELPRADYRGSLCAYNSEKQTCDAALLSGWYRAVGRNGDLRMQEMPADFLTCGTKFPIWMNGSHPTVAEGEVDATLVQAMTDQTMAAKVKNCNDEYYVYQLEPTRACPEAYCFGETEQDPCPPFDPCDIYEHERKEYNPVRSTSCNVDAPNDCRGREYAMSWVAFPDSLSGFLNVTELPPNGTCGFNYPMWIKETSAADADGISTNVVCTKTDDNPCALAGTLRSKVCKWYTVYEAPAPVTCGGPCSGTCSGYCLDDPTAACPVQQTTTDSTTTSETTDKSHDSCDGMCGRDYLWIIIVVVVLVLIASCVIAVILFMYHWRKREQTKPQLSVINITIKGHGETKQGETIDNGIDNSKHTVEPKLVDRIKWKNIPIDS